MHYECERCGASVATPDVGTATRTLCEICLPMTDSAERRERDSVISLDDLIQRAGARVVDRDDRVSLEIVGAPHHQLAVTPPLPERRRPGALWLGLGLLAGVILTLSGAALIEASAPNPGAAGDGAPAAELRRVRSDKATTVVQVPDLEPALEEEPAPVVEPEPEAATPTPVPPPAVPPAPSVAPPVEPAASGPTMPDRADVRAAMLSTHGAVARCAEGQHEGGRVVVRVLFRGANGSVSHAQVTSADGSLPPTVLSCVARAARGAEVPAFEGERFSVSYPYVL